jgi:hypothetical protein
MAKTKSNTSAKSDGRFYPSLEQFVETQSRGSVEELFAQTRAKLAEAKGTKAAGAKKASEAIDKTQALLHHLFDVRERLARESSSKSRK